MAQSHVFDYRREEGQRGRAHFGVPVSSVEVKVLNSEDREVGGPRPDGEVVVAGPAVVGGGEVRLGVEGGFGEDGTLRLR